MKKITKLTEAWRIWKKRISIVMACMVVFVTVYAMVLPAITLDQDAADQEEGLVLDTENTEQEPEKEETDTDSEEPDFSWEEDFSEEESLSEEELSREEYIKETWAAIEEPVTLQWPAEPEETEEVEEAEEVIFYDESGEEIDYFVEATFGEDSGLPADVTLEVSEIKAGTKEYEAYHKSSLEAVKKEGGKETEISYARFFDITFLNADGDVIEPTGPVSIVIRYKDEKELKAEAAEDLSVLHFAEEDQEEQKNQKNLEELPQPELMDIETEIKDDQVESITFGSESFSVYGVVGTYSVEVDAEEGEGGEHVSFSHNSSLKGGDSIFLSELLEEAWPDREDLRVVNVVEVTAGEVSSEDASADEAADGNILKVSFDEESEDYKITADTELEEDLSGQKGNLTVHFNDGNTAVFRITISGTPAVDAGDGLAVISSADGSYLPETAEGSAEELAEEDISDSAAETVSAGGSDTVSRVFDISLNLSQEEQEAYNEGFLVNLTLPEGVTGKDFHLYHIHDGIREELAIEKTGSAPDEAGLETVSAVQFVTGSFSEFVLQYTVDFHWEVDGKTFDFSIPGGGFVSLEHLVEALGIASADENTKNGGENVENGTENGDDFIGEVPIVDESSENSTAYEEAIRLNEAEVSEATKKFVTDVERVEFSSPELVWVGKIEEATTVGEIKGNKGLEVEYSLELTDEQIAEINAQTVEAGDWALISMQPFTSEETLTVTMKNGDQFLVKVTDERKTAVSQLEDEQEYVLYIVRNNHYYALDKDGHTVQVPNDDLESLDSDYLWTYEKKDGWREGSTWHNHSGTNYLDVYWTMEDGDNVPEDKGGSESKNYPVVSSHTSDNWEPIENLFPTGGGFWFRDLNNDRIYLAYVNGHVRAIDALSYAQAHMTRVPMAVTIYIYKQGTPYTVNVQVNDNEMGSVRYVHDTTSLETSVDTPVITVPTEKVESGNKKVLDNLVAVPKEGYMFTGWTIVKEEWDTASNVTNWGTSQTDATIRPTVSADKMTLQANFAPAIQYKFTVETNNAEYGLVGGTNATGKEVSGQESYEGQSTPVIGGSGKNPYAITATRKPGCRFVGWNLTNEDGDLINSYGTNGDGDNDWTFTLDARAVSLPSDNCTLRAVFEDKKDNEVNKTDIDKLLDDWAEDLKGDLTDADKTAHVVDPANRIYQINLSAASKKWIAYPSITLDFVTDISRSMYFPANMVEYGNFKSVGLESWLNSRTAEEKKKVYYVVSDLYDRSDGSKENAATVYAVWWNGSKWIYKDSSYKYHADYNTGGTEWTVNSTNVNHITIKKGTGTSDSNYQKLTGVIYTSSDPPTSYTSNNVNATINDEYWSRLDYLYKAVMTATETLKAIDPNATITLTTFNKASQHVGELESTEEAIFNQLSGIGLDGGTRQDEGLYSSRTGESRDENKGAGSNNGVREGLQGTTKDKFVIAITDGAPNFGNKYTGNPWEDAIKPQANKLKAIPDADGNLTLMTLCLGSKYVGTNEGDFASLSSDPSKYAKNANDGQAIVDAIEELVQHMLKKANLFGTATDTLDPAFYPVTATGDPVQENLYYDNNGVLIGNGRTKPSGYTPYCQWTRDGEQWKITYYNQTFKWADQGGWNRSFFVKAKENFLGGNAIETNDAASLKVTDAIIRDDQSQTHHTLKDKNGIAKPVTKTLPTPHVNVRQLLMNENNTRWTLYVETEVSPEPQIQKLFQNILVEELVEKSSAERVTVANNMIKDGDYMRPAATDETEPETFYLHTVIRDLIPTDWSNLKNPPDPEKPYIEIPYNGDKAYGHNAGVIRLTLTKTGKKAEYETHKTSESTSDKEEYVLTAQYIPNSAAAMLAAHNIDQATDQQKAKDDALWHTTFGESAGTEIRNGRPSTNKHIIDLFVRGLALTKTDETYNNGLAGAVFELYRPAIGNETASEDLPDGVPSGYVLDDTLAVNDTGVVYKNNIRLFNSPKTTYYLVEKTPPEGFIKHIGAIPMELEITNHYESPVANGATPVTTDGGEAPDSLYNWYQKASLQLDTTSGVIRTTGSYDPEDSSTNLTDQDVIPTSTYEVMYYRIKNIASTVDIVLHKVDDQGTALSGAAFKLMNGSQVVTVATEGDNVVLVEPKVSGQTVTVTDNIFTIPAGGVTIKNLETSEDEYIIMEVTPPAGYVITDSTPVKFKITAGQLTDQTLSTGVDYEATDNDFIIPNAPGAALPNTGGPGTNLLYLLSITMIGIASAGFVMKRRRKNAA